MPTKNLLVHNKTILGLAIGWTLLIAFVCLISFGELPKVKVSGIDKYVHATLHLVFTLLWGFYYSPKQSEIRIAQTIRIVFISLCYGIVIEILQQTLTTTRRADAWDVLANFIGALIALLVFLFLKKRKAQKSRY
ncbi:VanZ family protein [Flavobacterium sp.]